MTKTVNDTLILYNSKKQTNTTTYVAFRSILKILHHLKILYVINKFNHNYPPHFATYDHKKLVRLSSLICTNTIAYERLPTKYSKHSRILPLALKLKTLAMQEQGPRAKLLPTCAKLIKFATQTWQKTPCPPPANYATPARQVERLNLGEAHQAFDTRLRS